MQSVLMEYLIRGFIMYYRFNMEKKHHMMVPTPTEDFLKAVPDSKLEECNVTRAEEFFIKHTQKDDNNSLSFQRNARQLLSRATQHLDDLAIPFWISSGTFLGGFNFLT